MKPAYPVFLCLLLLCIAPVRADEAEPGAYFGLKGKVLVSEAKILIDGGTVIVSLQDEQGTSLRLVRAAAWTAEERRHNGIVIAFPKRIQGHYALREGGEEEEALLKLLRAASLNTFGSPEPPKSSGFPGSAVSRLIRFLSVHTHETQPESK